MMMTKGLLELVKHELCGEKRDAMIEEERRGALINLFNPSDLPH
jgi:hypothetical protein